MAQVHGIAAGGLFNEIFEAHIKGRTTRTEYVAAPPSDDEVLTLWLMCRVRKHTLFGR